MPQPQEDKHHALRSYLELDKESLRRLRDRSLSVNNVIKQLYPVPSPPHQCLQNAAKLRAGFFLKLTCVCVVNRDSVSLISTMRTL